MAVQFVIEHTSSLHSGGRNGFARAVAAKLTCSFAAMRTIRTLAIQAKLATNSTSKRRVLRENDIVSTTWSYRQDEGSAIKGHCVNNMIIPAREGSCERMTL